MKEFTIEITEILQKQIKIEAETYEGAIDKVKKMYKNEDIVLDYRNYVGYEIE